MLDVRRVWSERADNDVDDDDDNDNASPVKRYALTSWPFSLAGWRQTFNPVELSSRFSLNTSMCHPFVIRSAFLATPRTIVLSLSTDFLLFLFATSVDNIRLWTFPSKGQRPHSFIFIFIFLWIDSIRNEFYFWSFIFDEWIRISCAYRLEFTSTNQDWLPHSLFEEKWCCNQMLLWAT